MADIGKESWPPPNFRTKPRPGGLRYRVTSFRTENRTPISPQGVDPPTYNNNAHTKLTLQMYFCTFLRVRPRNSERPTRCCTADNL